MQDKQPLISVIVPIYKVEEYLPKCLDSIINQTYQNLEIILVDDGSPDNCGKICDEYAKKDQRIKVFHKKNGGVSSARNFGLDHCSGDFITYVDADDYLEPTMYEELVTKQKEKNTDLVFCRYKYIKDEKECLANEIALEKFCLSTDVKYFYNAESTKYQDSSCCVKEENIMCSIWRILFKWSAVQGVRFRTDIKYMEDVVYLTEILCHQDKTVDYIDRYLYNYTIRSGSASHCNVDGLIESHKNYLQAMDEVLADTPYAKFLPALKFTCYADIVFAFTRFNVKKKLQLIKTWNQRENYLASKKLIYGFKSKLKFFLVHYKFHLILKILLKINDRKRFKY